MKWTNKNWTILILNVLLSLSALAQEPVYKNFRPHDGLPSLQVYDIYQDDNGYIWFATDRGISRYNGYEFENFSTSDGITSNTVFKFFPQENGEIWCTTFNNTLFHFNTIDYRFIPYKNNLLLNKLAPKNTPPEDLLILENKTLLLSYSSLFGFISIDSASNVQDTLPACKEEDYLASQQIEQIEGHYFGYLNKSPGTVVNQISGGKLISWQQVYNADYTHTKQINGHSIFSNGNQVYLKKKDSLIKIIHNDLNVLNIGSYRTDEFWVSYEYGGFIVYDMQANVLRTYLKEVSGTFMHEDNEGGLWFSTISKGIFYTKSQEIVELNQFTNKYIHKLAVDSQDNLWVSIYNLGIYQLNNNKISYKLESKGIIIPSSYYDTEMDLNWNDVSNFDFYKNSFQFRYTRFNTNLQNYFTEIHDFIDSNVFEFQLNSISRNKESIVLATADGIYKIGLDSNLIKHDNSQLNTRIEDIECIGNYIFYGSFESGLFIEYNNSIEQFSINEGLKSNTINELFIENDSTVLVCSSKGINKLILSDKIWTIDSEVIMSNYDVTDLELIKDTLWVGTRSGLFKIIKNPFNKVYEESHYLRFTSFSVNNEVIPTSKLNKLKYYQNKLSVEYLAISFKNNDDLLYRYKLKNLENDWNYTKSRSLNYPAIPSGNYSLIIQASVDGETWEEEISFDVIIAPPFYFTAWFIGVICLFFILMIYVVLKLKILSYNKIVLDELFRLLIRKLKRKEKYIVIRELGKDIKIACHDILYIKSAGNYCEIHTVNKKHIARFKIGDYFELIPDKMEYLRIHRSYIIRIDQITTKSKNSVIIGNLELKVSNSYLKELKKIQF
ncbi:MAG: LytTR family transcriptional regulator DNA-binding domain-containing protein [Flavobacteriales bacterium]|nr:LytTR family transcriptional regulator DNA-binding domain-containing protein [Flavobacteriales bacterium]